MNVVEVSQASTSLGQLNRELLSYIFVNFSTRDVARARVVCKEWQAVLDDSCVRRDIFKEYWKLSRLINEPRDSAYYLEAALSSFAYKHVCQPRDTLTSIAVKYGVGAQDLKRLNNLMSDFSLHARTHVHIPVRSKLQIEGKVGQFYLDPIACRHLVLLLDDTAQAALPPAPAPAPAPVVPVGDAEDDIWRDRLTSMISRGLRINSHTARYYLAQAKGDVKTAFALYEDDIDWEVHFGHLMQD